MKHSDRHWEVLVMGCLDEVGVDEVVKVVDDVHDEHVDVHFVLF